MRIQRTIKLRVCISPVLIAELVVAYTSACNYVAAVAFAQGISNRRKLHDLCYTNIRAQFGLPSQIACSVITDVAAKYQAMRTAKAWPPASPVVFRRQPVLMQGGKDFSFASAGLSLSTIQGREKKLAWQGGPPAMILTDPAWKMGGGRLWVRKGKVYLVITMGREVDTPTTEPDTVIGIDRGMNYLAVAASEGQQAFFAGGRILHIRKCYRVRRRSLQRKKARLNQARSSTRNVRRVLKRLSGREHRFTRDTNHVVSKRLVQFALKEGRGLLVLEDLQGIRARVKHRKAQRAPFHSWAFYELEQLTRYKAEGAGVAMISVDAAYTSQACSKCGHTAKSQRQGHSFTCAACLYHCHSDLNAARNIRLRGVLARQALDQNGVSSTTPSRPDRRSGLELRGGQGQAPSFRAG